MIYNERNNTWAWRPDFDVRTPQDLLDLVKRRYDNAYPPSPHGFRLADLRESYPATREAVESFSKPRKRTAAQAEANGLSQGEEDAEGRDTHAGPIAEETKKLLILPGPREGSIRQVYYNEASDAAYIRKNENRLIEPVDEGMCMPLTVRYQPLKAQFLQSSSNCGIRCPCLTLSIYRVSWNRRAI